MTQEQLQTENDDLKNQLESVLNKNKEILGEVKKLKNASREHNVDDLLKQIDEQDAKISSLESTNKKLNSEFEKTTAKLGSTTEHLNKLTVTDGLTNALIKAGVDDGLIDGAKAILKSKVTVGDDFTATIDGKSLEEHATEWIKGDGVRYAKPDTTNGGGGGNGNNNGAGISEKDYFDKRSPNFSLSKQGEIFKQNPDLYKKLKG